MLKSIKTTIGTLLRLFFAFIRACPLRISSKRCNEFIFIPVFTSFDEMIDQVYRLTWYLPLREGVSIEIYYNCFEFSEKDLSDISNRAWYMHSLPINLSNIRFLRMNNLWMSKIYLLLVRAICGSQIVLWQEPKKTSFFHKLIQLTGNLSIVDHKNCSYASDVNYVTLIHKCMQPKEFEEIRDLSKCIFSKKIESIRNSYNKVYIFGRGPSFALAFNFDFSDGVRIICNQTVNDQKLMGHINPNIIIGGDHCWNFGCSKLAEYFRRDMVNWVMKNDVILVMPLDCYPLMIHQHSEIKDKMVGVPYCGNKHNFNLLDDFFTKGSLGVLFEFLFPIACTVANNIKMLGFDGNDRRNVDPDCKVAFSHYKAAEYPDKIVNSIHGSRPGYYDRDLSDFRRRYDSLFKSMVDEAEAKGFEIETLAPSYHTALKDKFRGSSFNNK